jgi:hypothetical protein
MPTHRTRAPRSIEEDTGIMTMVLAETVVERAAKLLDHAVNTQEISGYLVGHADAVYEANAKFRKAIQSEADHGNRGRDTLFAYMQHWVSSKILRDTENAPSVRAALVDSGFSTGRW